jgi:hypothetical protein
MKLTEFMAEAKLKAFENGVADTSSVSVYAFCEFENTYFVCQAVVDGQVLRAPVMHSPESAISAFVDSLRHYKENGDKKQNSDIII